MAVQRAVFQVAFRTGALPTMNFGTLPVLPALPVSL